MTRDDDPTEPATATRPSRKWSRKWVLIGAGAALVVTPLIGLGAWSSYRATAASSDVTDAFLDALHRGDVDGAYARLSPRRRDVMTRAELAAFAERVPAFKAAGDRQYTRHRSWVTSEDKLRDSRSCIRGYLEAPDGEWGLQIYAVRVGHDEWFVQSFGVCPPKGVQPADLLDECADSGHATALGEDAVQRTSPLP